MRVNITRAFAYNVSGYDREARQFVEGEQDVPDVVGEFVRANGEYGQVLGADGPESAASPAEKPLSRMNRDELVAELANRDIADPGGTKKELIALIEERDARPLESGESQATIAESGEAGTA